MYRIVKEDSKADKAWNHYAASVEMVALCLFMYVRSSHRPTQRNWLDVCNLCTERLRHRLARLGDAVVREIRERMETAAKYYLIGKSARTNKDQDHGTRFATRATLLYIGMLRCLGPKYGTVVRRRSCCCGPLCIRFRDYWHPINIGVLRLFLGPICPLRPPTNA